jgi:hypothetical protein
MLCYNNSLSDILTNAWDNSPTHLIVWICQIYNAGVANLPTFFVASFLGDNTGLGYIPNCKIT